MMLRHSRKAGRRLAKATCLLTVVLFTPACSDATVNIQSALHPASGDAGMITRLWWWMLAGGAVVLAAVLVALGIGLWRGRRNGDHSPSFRLGWGLVLTGGVIAPLLAAVLVVVFSVRIGHSVTTEAPEPYVTIDVVGRRWWWEVRYRDAGAPAGDEPVAVTANEIHIPVGEPVRVRLHSDNVIHSFWVPNLQGKADVIPGQVNELWLNAGEAGVFRGQCTEYCGLQHALMGFLVVAEPAEAFDEWLRVQAAPAVEPVDPAAVRGRDVFMESACSACHTVRGTPADGEQGPDLTHVAGRRTLAAATIENTPGHMGGWVADPQNVKPGSLMPPTPLGPQELRALITYLETLR